MSKENRYPIVMAFRLDGPAKARLDAVAAAHAMAPAIWVRLIVVREIGAALELPPIRRRILHRDLLREALGELGTQGSNLNQCARRLNAGGTRTVAMADLASMRDGYLAALRALTSLLAGGAAP